MQRLILVAMLLGGLSVAACIKTQRTVVITPGATSEELAGARWPKLPVHYCVQRSQEGFVDFQTLVRSAQRAFAEWGLGTAFDGECQGDVSKGNGRNEIYWAQLGEDENRLTEAGSTFLRYRKVGNGSPEIIEADIAIDVNPPRRERNASCLHTTLLHEAGHFFGVQHLSPPAVMAPVISECIQDLTQADRDALAALYPNH